MKKFLCFLLTLVVSLSLCGCNGSFGSANLKDPIAIPSDGVISKNILSQIQEENAIAVFTGSSHGISYEWTIFGSDISQVQEVNLAVTIELSAEYPKIRLAQENPFGFSALLSLYLNDQWDAQSATAYGGEKAVASVSLTGSKTTILNMTLDGSEGVLVIRPDAPMDQDEPIDSNAPSETELPHETTSLPQETEDSYLSKVEDTEHHLVTEGKDPYLTDPVPEGKPQPVEPENQTVNSAKAYTCTFSIECSTIFNNLEELDPDKLELIPSNGVILPKSTVTFYEGESVFQVLQRLCKEQSIHLESTWTPIYNSAYIEGIHNLYEFDCGSLSGWMYRVNGWYPNYGSSRYMLQEGDHVEWRFTCDLGKDIGGGYAVGG